MQTQVKTASGYIYVQTGSEGPRHDPYGYEEVALERNGTTIMIHQGLACYLEIKKRRSRKTVRKEWSGVDYDKKPREEFVKLTGFTPEKLVDFVWRAQNRCPEHGMRYMTSMAGFPGETLTCCGKCHLITGGSFDRSAIE